MINEQLQQAPQAAKQVEKFWPIFYDLVIIGGNATFTQSA
jgi:hypothetical protein